MDPYSRRVGISGATHTAQSIYRVLHPHTPSNTRFYIFLFTSFVNLLFCLKQAAELRAARLAAPAPGSPAASDATKDGSAGYHDAKAAAAPAPSPAPPDLLHVEVGSVILCFGLLVICLHDAWFLYQHLIATPDCYVIDHGVRTSETCEALYARLGRDKFTVVNT